MKSAYIHMPKQTHMRVVSVLTVILILSACTSSNNKKINFLPIAETELNFPSDTMYAIPHGKIWDERKHLFDSCMGSSYAANAIFMRTKDTFFVGSIVDMKTMKIVKRFDLPDSAFREIGSALRFTTKPCYEKRPIDIPIDSLMNNTIIFKVDSFNDKLNEELLAAVKSSTNTEIETGEWVNMELTSFAGTILDTTTNPALLEYKKALLTPGNMILVRSSAVTQVSFYFHVQKPLSNELINKLSAKPISIKQPMFQSQLYYIDPFTFKITLNGFFQSIGQFMKCTEQ